MTLNNIVKALEGDESLLLVLPKEVAIRMDIADQDWLKYEIMNGNLVINKVTMDDLNELSLHQFVAEKSSSRFAATKGLKGSKNEF